MASRADAASSTINATAWDERSPRVVIVGAGFGGIAAAIELRRHGIDDILVLEAAAELGGTWFHNRYPGAACDVPSHLYSYSFEQRRTWSRLCSPQPEILNYLNEVVDAHGIRPLVRTSSPVTRCAFDGASSRWIVTTQAGERHQADALVLATGQLNRPSIPRLPGRERFSGHSFHSARWDHDYRLAGKRVAVIGSGASAVQFVPPVARQALQLTVFQRTGNWMLPRENRVYPRWLRRLIQAVTPINWVRRRYLFNYCELLTMAIRRPRTIGRVLGLRSRLFMHRQLRDPELRRKVMPDYTFGCKRVLFSSQYLRTLARPNVELVTEPLSEVTEHGIRTADGLERQFDCIIWGTGFRASEFMAPMQVVGLDGRELSQVWRNGAHAHLGLTVPGFPSMFLMYGPNTNTSGGSIIVYHEAQAAYIRQALSHLRAGGYARLEVRPEVESRSDAEIQSRFAGTAWTGCDSWYRAQGGRIVANWPGYMHDYLDATRTFEPAEYAFTLSRQAEPQVTPAPEG